MVLVLSHFLNFLFFKAFEHLFVLEFKLLKVHSTLAPEEARLFSPSAAESCKLPTQLYRCLGKNPTRLKLEEKKTITVSFHKRKDSSCIHETSTTTQSSRKNVIHAQVQRHKLC